jgi:phosphoglycerate dehydrogenase-like enzyme
LTRVLRGLTEVSVRAGLVLMLAVMPAGTASVAAQQTRGCPECDDGAALIARFGLREGPTPVRELPGWAPPRRVVTPFDDAFVAALRAGAPGVEVVRVANLAEATAALAEADVWIGPCRADVVRAGTALRWIQLRSAGAETCAGLEVLRERGVLVTNAQAIYGPQIAEHALALMLSLSRGLHVFAAHQRDAVWNPSLSPGARPDGPWELGGLWELGGKTLLVVGLGGIGTELATRAHALGMRVIAIRNSGRDGPAFVEYVGLPDELVELAARADVVVNATPLTPATRAMFDARVFAAMKPTAYFINVGRGESVVTEDLVDALRQRRLAGAGLDVMDPEPLPADHPLWHMPNVVLTPHVAVGSDYLAPRFVRLVIENLGRYTRGDRLLSVVDLQRGY